jgi:hypothetical protein
LNNKEREDSSYHCSQAFENANQCQVRLCVNQRQEKIAYKIHAHAGFPPSHANILAIYFHETKQHVPIPSILEMAAWEGCISWDRRENVDLTASNPPKAPETVAAEKNIAARIPNSERLYQLANERNRFIVLNIRSGKRTMKGNSSPLETIQPRTSQASNAFLWEGCIIFQPSTG